MTLTTFLFAAVALSAPAQAQSELERGFDGALRGCEEWLLNPASWAQGTAPFTATIGLGDKMGLLEEVPEVALPPEQLQIANHYWRINSTKGAGYFLVVSDRLPICHITGGGDTDLQPAVEAIITSSNFQQRWEKITDLSEGEMASTEFRSREVPSLSLVISRAKMSGQRLDRVQVISTASYQLKH